MALYSEWMPLLLQYHGKSNFVQYDERKVQRGFQANDLLSTEIKEKLDRHATRSLSMQI